ncbi:inactive disease susceptibility protein LOV1-like [Fagus crenata]
MESFGAVSRASTEMQGRPLNTTSEVSAIEGHSCGGDQYYQESDVLVERQDAEKELISRLIDKTEENLGVILVMSEEAVGKTALAWHVYNRLDIRKHFPLRVWLHVRKEFAYKDLLVIVLKQTPIRILKDLELMSEQELCQMVFETLVKFKFLVVLDDVCTVDVWVKLLRAFADAGNGSRIILTTRHSNVESQFVPWSCPLNLMQLTKEESWVLFLKKVGSRRAEKCSDINTEELRRNFFTSTIAGQKTVHQPIRLMFRGLQIILESRLPRKLILEIYVRMFLSSLKNKVLDLEGVYKPLLPEKLGELRYLKYLGLRWTGLDSCPTSIGDLSNLETIDLKYTSITTLPSSIWKANKLRHLYMNEVSIPKPLKVFPTNQLQTLMGLSIDSKGPRIFESDRFTNLRKLGLTCHSKSTQGHSKLMEDTADCISKLRNLQTLRLRSRGRFGQPLELVLSSMRNHQSLSNLYLFGVITDGISNLPRNLKMLTLSLIGAHNDGARLDSGTKCSLWSAR